MRDIKFRLWHKSIKQMLHFDNVMGIMDGKDRYGIFFTAVEGKMFMGGDQELMQYTGLNDKNGKEIYEGDIVRLFDFDHEIVFQCGAFILATKKNIDYDNLSSKIEKYTGRNNNPYFCMNDNVISLWEAYCNFCEESDYVNCCEVIGNIYENPELLEVSK